MVARISDGQTVRVSSHQSTVNARQQVYSIDIKTGVMTGGVPYGGRYTVTPSEETQTLPTTGAMMRGDITVEAIPDNYGRIGWDGSVLTVY